MSRLKNPSIHVDPVLAVVVGAVVAVGGGLGVYGLTQNGDADAAPAAQSAPVDSSTARALAVVKRADATAATTSQQQLAARAERASAKGSSVDPFARGAATSTTSTGASGATGASGTTGASGATGTTASGAGTSTSSSAVTQAHDAVATSGAANTAVEAATGGSTGTTTTTTGPVTTTTAAGPTTGATGATTTKAAELAAIAKLPARVSLRIATDEGRHARARQRMGVLLPDAKGAVARVVRVSRTGRVVTLRLRAGARLTGKQSPGTACVTRARTGDRHCVLVHVRAGRTAVIRAADGPDGTLGAVTALRVLSVWRGTHRVAG